MTLIRNPIAREVQSEPAGIVTRVSADLVDFALVAVFYVVSVLLVGTAEALLTNTRWHVPNVAGWIHLIGFPLIFAVYFAVGWTFTGRSIGKRIFGLRLLSRDGDQVGALRATIRALLCVVIIGPISMVWCIFSSRRAAVHDLILRTKVIYDWRSRPPT